MKKRKSSGFILMSISIIENQMLFKSGIKHIKGSWEFKTLIIAFSFKFEFVTRLI